MKNKTFLNIAIIVIVLAFLLYLFAPIFFTKQPPKTQFNKNTQQQNPEPKFFKHAELFVYDDNDSVKTKFDIEVVQDEMSKARGLMFRKSMEENQGMLFIFDQEKLQSFWMRNTYISLDIIFIDSNKKIVHIAKNTVPLTDTPVPSIKPAIYVFEIKAGLSDKLGLKEGDRINF
jgi:uncharacterized protein